MTRKIKFLKRLTRRERLFISLLFFCVFFYFVISLIVVPQLRFLRQSVAMIEEKRETLEGYRRILEKERGLNREIELLEEASQRFESHLLENAKPALAAAELQNRVKEMAGIYGLEITSEKIGQTARIGNYLTIPVEIIATGEIGQIKDFLYDIETGTPLLNISEMTIRTNKKRKLNPVTRKYEDYEQLQVIILINGLMKS